MKQINVEGNELALKNSNGDIVIVPKKDRTKVEQFIKTECWGCVDNYVSGLPKMSNYAKDGSVITDGDPPTKWQVPQSTQQYTVTDKARNLQDGGQEAVNKKAAKIIKSKKPMDGFDKRHEYLKQFTPEEKAVIKSSDNASVLEPSMWSKFDQAIRTSGAAGLAPSSNSNLTYDESKEESTPLNLLQPLNVIPKLGQALYRSDYTMGQALRGTPNNASAAEDALTDFTNYTPLVGAKMVKAGLLGAFGTKFLKNSTDNILEGISKLNPFKTQSVKNVNEVVAPGHELLFMSQKEANKSNAEYLNSKPVDPNPYTYDYSLINQRFNIREDELNSLMDQYRKEFEDNIDVSYDEQDLGLYAKYRHAEKKQEELLRNAPHYKSNEVDEFKARNTNEHILTPTEEILLDSYTRGYDQKINRRSRKNHSSVFYENFINPKLEELIKKSKLTTDESFLRGTQNFFTEVERNGEKVKIEFKDLQDDDIFIPNSFVSTSIDRPFFGSPTVENFLSQYDMPKNSSYLLAEHPSNHMKGENEVLLPSKLKFKTTRVKEGIYKKFQDMPDGLTTNFAGGTYTKKGKELYKENKITGELKKVPEDYTKAFYDAYHRYLPKFKFTPINPYSLGALYLLNKNRTANTNNSQETPQYQTGGITKQNKQSYVKQVLQSLVQTELR